MNKDWEILSIFLVVFELVKKNIKVVFLIQKPLKDLFQNIDKKITIVCNETELPKFDYSISLSSILFRFK